MDTLQEIPGLIKGWLNIPLFKIGADPVTLWTIVSLVVLFVLLLWLTKKLKNLIVLKLLANSRIDIGVRQATGSIVRYIIIAIGFVVILQTVGIDLSTVTVLAGALGIGVGFGLQSITNNLVSGLILLFERPIKIGDRIEVGEVTGDVVDISVRATTVITNDNIAIIIPNAEFIGSTVTNWSYTTRDVRFNFPVRVSYREDPEAVRKLLLEVAGSHPGVLQERKSDVLFQEFGESCFQFILRVWTRDYTDRPGVLRSELNYAISRKFREHGIEIPYPQRDIHIKDGQLTVAAPPPSHAP
ncbi:MAG: mechanosensitive ion channel protein MscS [Nitrospira sp. ST-bin4]|jgi:small-conductance mechanosensitive channel|nr:MAG: mechanosensitive ion channel protein MscS [Nitrospira sp. ST-bin4]